MSLIHDYWNLPDMVFMRHHWLAELLFGAVCLAIVAWLNWRRDA